jgi:hypothetical protein
MKTARLQIIVEIGIITMMRNIIEAAYNLFLRQTVEEFRNEDWGKVYKEFKENTKHELWNVFGLSFAVAICAVPSMILWCIDYIYWEIYGRNLL